MFKFDSVHGKFGRDVYAKEGKLVINDEPIDVFSEHGPADIRGDRLVLNISSSRL